MRWDRTGWRLIKFAVLFGAIGLVGEALFEVGKLSAPFVDPPSVPGQGKIIEHFAFQHVLLPFSAVLVVFWPAQLQQLFASPIARVWLAAVVALVTIPEVLVSFKSDLFREYPFQLHSELLQQIQMQTIGGLSVNVLQLQHLVFAHLALMGTVFALCVRPEAMRFFAGPRTGELTFDK
jgi:hypothetical protein